MIYRPSKFIIAREAWPFAIPVGIAALISAFFLPSGIAWTFTILFAIIFIYVLAFFRNPNRTGPAEPNAVWSPADGKIVAAGLVAHPDFPDGQALRIAIFMNVFNVHVNWAPVTGRVTAAAHHCGKFLNAMQDKCGDENERKVLAFRTPDDTPVLVKLVAGLVARRIVCPLDDGDEVHRGDKIGLIRFGSRVEVFLPANCALNVTVGQFVRGSQTSIATLVPLPRPAGNPERSAEAMAHAPTPVPAGG